jgi:hypothetical protein
MCQNATLGSILKLNTYVSIEVNWTHTMSIRTLFASCVKDFTRPELTAVECTELMSDSFVYYADAVLGKGPVTKGSRCDENSFVGNFTELGY